MIIEGDGVMTDDLPTLLQALYGSEELQGYICSVLPPEGLRTGWLEQGLTLKSLKSSLSTKANQSRYVRPTESVIRLMCDRAMDSPKNFGISIMGRSGLSAEKMFVLISDSTAKKGSKWATSFWSKSDAPLNLVRIVNKSLAGPTPTMEIDEPNIDYVEQLKEDSSDGAVEEAIVLKIPKSLSNEATWLKNALSKTDETSDDLLFSYGTINESPAFGLLFSKALSNLEFPTPAKSLVFASILVKHRVVEVVLWDSPRAIASFILFKKMSPESIAWKYLLPLWATSDDRLEVSARGMHEMADSQDASETVLESEAISPPLDKEIKLLHSRIADIDASLSKVNPEKLSKQIDLLEKRSESIRLAIDRIGELEKAVDMASTQDSPDFASLDLLQNRLQAIMDRMELLGEKLSALEKRVIAITDAWSEE